MKLKFFSINALDPEPDQQALDDFCSRHRLVATEKRFVEHGDYCYWSVCVTYLEAMPLSRKPNKVVDKRAQVDYREVLSEADFIVYAKLRDLRKEISEAEAIPVYGILSNAQLAEMVTSRVLSLNKMGEINGVGQAKLDKYGERFLAIMKDEFSAYPLPAETTDEAQTAAAG
ncbi:MAG: HRDC domain-containing protein [Thiolinea sp.]